MSLTQRQKAGLIIHSFATAAAVWSAATAMIPVFGPLLGDTTGLTAITVAMTYSLAKVFGKSDLEGGVWAFGAVVLGATMGISALRAVTSIIPGVGSLANAAITFTLHEATGWGIALIFEEGRDPTTLSANRLKDYVKRGKNIAETEKAMYEQMIAKLPSDIQARVENLQKRLGQYLSVEDREAIMAEIERLVASST